MSLADFTPGVTVANADYTGSAAEPAVTVMDGETTLTQGTDYTVTYSNNTEEGENTATATITGKGFYLGTVSKTFTITNNPHTITVSTSTGGSIAATVGDTSASEAKMNDVVTLTATPSEGYLLSDLSVVDGSSNKITVTDMLWYTGTNTATFTMPGSAVTVTPTFTSTSTAADGLYINMPVTGTKTATIPSGVRSFKVYDDGGVDENYESGCDGYLTLTAPTGHVLQLSGSIKTEAQDFLTVYDGTGSTAATLIDAVSSTTDGNETNINTVVSSGQSMTLYFHSDDKDCHEGLDLTVKLVKLIELDDDNDYSTTLSGANGWLANVTLKRAFPEGKYQTICLPFVPSFSGFDVYEFTGIEDKRAKMTECDIHYMEANTPYVLIRTEDDVTSIDFGCVEIDMHENPQTAPEGSSFVFKGTYTQKHWLATDNAVQNGTIYGFMQKDNDGQEVGQFVKARRETYLRPFSCWLEYSGEDSGELDGFDTEVDANEARAVNRLPDVIDIIWQSATGETTGISHLDTRTGEIFDTDEWYSLDGRRLSGKPTAKGLYIHHGAKVIIK